MDGPVASILDSEGESPAAEEIASQLNRMLVAERFRNAPNRADFLNLVVERALKGKKSPGRIIAKALFPGKSAESRKMSEMHSNTVRVTAGNLRKTIQDYYAREGREDPVVIDLPEPPADPSIKLPEGVAYTPVFSYNPNHAATKEYKLGEYYRLRGMADDHICAARHYHAALTLIPNHVQAAIGFAEVWASLAFWASGDIDQAILLDALQWSATFLDRVSKTGARYWRVHAVGGFLLLAANNQPEARAAFQKALSLNRLRTEDYPPYFFFLMVSGSESLGLALAKRHWQLHIDDMAAYVVYARVLFRAHLLEECVEILKKSLDMDKGHWEVYLMLSNICSMLGHHAAAQKWMKCLKFLADDTTVSTAKAWAKQITTGSRGSGEVK